MFISMFRSDIGMKLVSVTWVYGRIPGLPWLFSKLIIPFQRRFLCHTLHPDEKTPQFLYKKSCLHPPHLSTHHPPTPSLSGGAQLQRALEIMASMDAEEAFEDHLREGSLWVVHSWRLTWNIIMGVWKIIFVSKLVICRFHVNLPGCTVNGSETRLTNQLRER